MPVKNLRLLIVALMLCASTHVVCQDIEKDTCSLLLHRSLMEKESWAITLRSGELKIVHGKKIFRFPLYYKLDCLYFNFDGLYIKTEKNEWKVGRFWKNEKIIVVSGLDDLGRLLVFVVDVEKEKLLLHEDRRVEFFMPRYNKIYFDPSKLVFAQAGHLEVNHDSGDVKYPVHYTKLDPRKGLKFEKKIYMKSHDYDDIIPAKDLF